MLDTAYFVKSVLPRLSFIGSFKHFVGIYFSKSVCISACGGGGRVSSKSYLLPSFIFWVRILGMFTIYCLSLPYTVRV